MRKLYILILLNLTTLLCIAQIKPTLLVADGKLLPFNSLILSVNIDYNMFEVNASAGAFTHTLILAGQSGEYMTIYWGDGQDTTFIFTGSTQSIVHDYSLGTYRQTWRLMNAGHLTHLDAAFENLYGDITETDVLKFRNLSQFIINNNSFTGDLSGWSTALSNWGNVTKFRIYLNSFTGDLSGWSTALSNWGSVTDFRLNNNSFTGDLSGWSTALSNWGNVTDFWIYSNSFTGDLSGWSTALSNWGSVVNFWIHSNSFTGDLSGWSTALSNWGSVVNFYIHSNSFTGDLSGWSTALSNWGSVVRFRVYSNSFTGITNTQTTAILDINASGNAITSVSQIDNLFSGFDTYFSSNTPVKNLTVDVSGGTNASPTGGSSNTNIVNLESTFTTAGYVFTAIIN